MGIVMGGEENWMPEAAAKEAKAEKTMDTQTKAPHRSGRAAPERLVIASRESRLAMWQAQHIRDRLRALYPETAVDILGMSTRGDRMLDRPLAQIGGKGLFIKELETAMLEGRADLAVHSLKDVPMEMPPGFAMAAIGARENPCDAFVSNRYASLDELPAGAVLGSSSLRRAALMRARHPHLRVESLRGNLDTRLRKLDEGHYDAIILAAAGLIRLGLRGRIRAILTPEVSLPAPGQGALGIEIAAGRDDLLHWLAPLNDVATAQCVTAERAFSRALGGSCQVPLGGYAVIEEMGGAQTLWLRGFVAAPDGTRIVRGELRGAPAQAEHLGGVLAQQLIETGASEILASLVCA